MTPNTVKCVSDAPPIFTQYNGLVFHQVIFMHYHASHTLPLPFALPTSPHNEFPHHASLATFVMHPLAALVMHPSSPSSCIPHRPPFAMHYLWPHVVCSCVSPPCITGLCISSVCLLGIRMDGESHCTFPHCAFHTLTTNYYCH